MNRDESSMRPADPPAVLDGTPMIVAPRDRKAGGTWLGASGAGLVVALSNRRGRTSLIARSRGQLVLEALRQPSVAGVDVFLQREVRNTSTTTGTSSRPRGRNSGSFVTTES